MRFTASALGASDKQNTILTPGPAHACFEVDAFVPLGSEIRLVRLVERLWGDVDHPSVDIHKPSGWLSIGSDGGLEPIQKWNLRRLQLATRLAELEPFDAVDLGKVSTRPDPGGHSIW
jgi:hypothetical protein